MDKQLSFVWVEPDAAQINPYQWKVHPPTQMDALNRLIFDRDGKDYVGWAGVVLINDRQESDGWATDQAIPTVVDGHGRLELAAELGEKVPALIGQWTPLQEGTILATLDPLAALAVTQPEELKALRAALDMSDELDSVVADLLAQAGEVDLTPPSLDDLTNKYGELSDSDTHPMIRFQVDPVTFARYQRLLELANVEEPELFSDMVSITLAAYTAEGGSQQ